MPLIILEMPAALATLAREGGGPTRTVLQRVQEMTVVDVVRDDRSAPGDREVEVESQEGRLDLARWLVRRPYFRSYRSYLVLSARSSFTVNYPPGA